MRVYVLSDTGVQTKNLDGGVFDALALASAEHDRGNVVVDNLGRDMAPRLPSTYDERGI